MQVRRPLRPIGVAVLLLALAPEGFGQSEVCTKCFHIYDVHGDWIGMSRIECPCCAERCAGAADEAARLRASYGRYRAEYDRVRQEKVSLEAAGQSVPVDLIRREALLHSDLALLELQWEMLKERCPGEVQGTIWEGSAGPVGDPQSEGGASESQGRYEDLSHQAAHQVQSILEFLETAADGYAPPATGYQDERAQVLEGYRDIGSGYGRLAHEPGGADEGTGAATEPVTAAEPEAPAPAGASAHERAMAAALASRLRANARVLAYQEALRRCARARAAGQDDAAEQRARQALEFAWMARTEAAIATHHQHRADRAHQKALDEALEAAAKRGASLADLLARFQAAGDEDLPKLTAAEVEAFLEARRAAVMEEDSPEPPDLIVLDLQLAAARSLYYDLRDRTD